MTHTEAKKRKLLKIYLIDINHLVKIFSSEKKYNKDSILKSSPYMNCNTHFKLKNKNRVLIYATHNLYFAKMADYKLQIHDGKIKTYNARI